MASKPIKDPVTQVAACDVPRAKLDIDYMTNLCLHMQRASASAWAAAQVWRPGNDFQGTQILRG